LNSYALCDRARRRPRRLAIRRPDQLLGRGWLPLTMMTPTWEGRWGSSRPWRPGVRQPMYSPIVPTGALFVDASRMHRIESW